jgi:hypothetical protein
MYSLVVRSWLATTPSSPVKRKRFETLTGDYTWLLEALSPVSVATAGECLLQAATDAASEDLVEEYLATLSGRSVSTIEAYGRRAEVIRSGTSSSYPLFTKCREFQVPTNFGE